jgi:hypothetical protein
MLIWFFLIIVTVILTVYCIFFLYNKQSVKNYSSNVSFPSLSYIYKIIDNSIYFQRMNKADLAARDVTSVQAYIKLYKGSVLEFSPLEKTILIELANYIDLATASTKNFKNIPWKFVKSKRNIEHGYPHTLGDMIILPDTFFRNNSKQNMMITLFHEKCHVYQRLFPLETHFLILDYWQLKPLDTITRNPLARNNPDINNFIYGTKEGTKFFQTFSSSNPTDLNDSIVVSIDNKGNHTKFPMDLPKIIHQSEHPYEIMGCLLPHIVLKNYGSDNSKNELVKGIKDWISDGHF